MLTAKQRQILDTLYNGKVPERYQEEIPELLKKSYVVEENGNYRLTDKALTDLNLAQGFGGAIADAFIPGAGSGNQETRK